MNDNQNAFIMLIIVLCLVIYLSIMYKKQNKNTYESFYGLGSGSYQDVKTKTLNWCNKMQKTGLLTTEQLNECQSSFIDVKSGTLPKDFKIPDTGVSRNYSLYNTRINKLTPNVSGENTNTVMLVSNDGQYLACNPDNIMYYISNINEPSVNQQEIYFTLIPQNENVYVIMSPYGKYLIANQPDSSENSNSNSNSSSNSNSNNTEDWTATFTGSSIGTMASWNVVKTNIENSSSESDSSSSGSSGSSSYSKVSFECVQLNNFFLSSITRKNKALTINYGKTDNSLWTMIPKQENTNSESSFSSVKTTNTVSQYIVLGENIIANITKTNIEIICLQATRIALVKLQDMIRNNYTNISNYMQSQLNNKTKLYNLSTAQYKSRLDSLKSSSDTSDNQQQIISNIPPPSGSNINNNDINTVLSNIDNQKNVNLQNIETDIKEIDIKLNSLTKTYKDYLNDYNNYIIDLNNKIKSVEFEIKQNNVIMDRQQSNYEKLNQDYSYINEKKHNVENIDKIAKLNTNLIKDYSNNNSLLIRIYPIIICLMILCILYLSYITYKNFIKNIYTQY
jgi:hypothetical protein